SDLLRPISSGDCVRRPSSHSPKCNQAITLVMQRMNERTMRHLGLSRRELFEKVERAALNGLPAEDWEFAEWRRARVNFDYHIEVHDFLYSVPHALIR